MSLAKVKLHPISVKLINRNHPWVIADDYTKRFPKENLLLGVDDSSKVLATLLHDQSHPKIKARVWQRNPTEVLNIPQFREETIRRLERAISKRKNPDYLSIKNRENYYLCFGEADSLPGLHILKLGTVILLQYYAFTWKEHEKTVLKYLKEQYPSYTFYSQVRDKEGKFKHVGGGLKNEFELKEFGLKYKVKIGNTQDLGIYTDMSYIRHLCFDHFKEAEHVLNLFSYTGAFSLLGQKYCKETTSVDLSKKYMSWLEENLELNELQDGHQSYVGSVTKAIKKFLSSGRQFDLIISDPPSSSTDGKKRTNSVDYYKDNLKSLYELMSVNGKLILFCNTHKYTRKKFRIYLEKLIQDNRLKGKLVIDQELRMKEDCQLANGFPEGDYLKGYLLKKES